MRIDVNFTDLSKIVNSIQEDELKNEMDEILSDIRNEINNYNNIEDTASNSDLKQSLLDRIMRIMDNTHHFIQRSLADEGSKDKALFILHTIKQSYQSCLTSSIPMTSVACPINEDNLPIHRLRLEQQLLFNQDKFALRFNETLKAIRKEGRRHIVPRNVFICYAWPDENHSQDQDLYWLQSFLTGLREHLSLAGIYCRLDIKDSVMGGNIYSYMKEAGTSEFVLLIGTKTLARKHQQGISSVCNELIEIRRKRMSDFKNNNFHVIPILLEGDFESSFPPYFELYTNVTNWKDKKTTYFNQLRSLIAFLYRTDEKIFDNCWAKFLDSLSVDEKRIFIEGLSLPAISQHLQLEKKVYEQKEEKLQSTSAAILSRLIGATVQSISVASSPEPSSPTHVRKNLPSTYGIYNQPQPTLPSKPSTQQSNTILIGSHISVASGGQYSFQNSTINIHH